MLDKLINKESKEYLDYLRAKREPLLKAFDIYKSNVAYGVVTETEAQHKEIIKWYNDILNLKEEAIRNIPTAVKKYL